MERVDFTAFLINQAPISLPNRSGYYRLGVDVRCVPHVRPISCMTVDALLSVWLRQCCAPFQRAHAQAGQNPELRTLYYRSVDLLARPVAVVFVVDGPDRPTLALSRIRIGSPRGRRISLMRLGLSGLR